MAGTPHAPRVKLQITEELIEDAIPRDSPHCLWAEAVKAAVPDAKYISVDIQTIRFTDPRKGLRYTYLTPRIAQVALIQFDQGIRPTPHSVQLRNGQVTPSGGRNKSRQTPLSDREIARRKAAPSVMGKGKAKLGKPIAPGSVPERRGGKTPPIAAGQRRAFGVRGLEY